MTTISASVLRSPRNILKALQSAGAYRNLTRKFGGPVDVREAHTADQRRFLRFLYPSRKASCAEIESFRIYVLAVDTYGHYMGSLMLQSYHLGHACSDYCVMYNVQVLPRYRRRGIAEMLIRKAFSAARNRGFKEIFLNTAETNFAAVGLFSKMGFEIAKNGDMRIEFQRETSSFRKKMIPLIIKL